MRSRTWKLVRLAAPLGLIPLFACLSPPVESPKTTVTQETSVRVEQSVKNKVDLLFLVDNSPSMAPKENELKSKFPQLIKILDDFAAKGNPASYHIGVVNSDLGSGPFTLNQGQCHPGGDGAKLQVTPATGAADVPAACTGFSLSGGVRYLDYNQLAGTNNIMGGLDVPTAFSCMSSVGEAGCGFEHQLEATYRSLHDTIAENTGFLRSDAILAVVFVTDEDDCSAPPTSDLFDPSTNGVNMYGTLHSFRCTQFGIQCNGMPVPPMSVSGLTGCESQTMANGGKLFDVQKYIDFFTKPAAQGGVKVDPNDVILVGITSASDPVGVSITMPCADQVNTASCPILSHSCVQPGNVMWNGDPAVRINTVVKSAKHNNLTSVCDTDYTAAIQALGELDRLADRRRLPQLADRQPPRRHARLRRRRRDGESGRLDDDEGDSVVRRERPCGAVLAGHRQAGPVQVGGLHAAGRDAADVVQAAADLSAGDQPGRQHAAARDRVDRSRPRWHRQAEPGAGGHDRERLVRDHRLLDVVVAFAATP